MKGINRSYAICIKQKRSPRGVLQKSYFGKFCKILAKNCWNLLINPNLGGFLGVRFGVGGGE